MRFSTPLPNARCVILAVLLPCCHAFTASTTSFISQIFTSSITPTRSGVITASSSRGRRSLAALKLSAVESATKFDRGELSIMTVAQLKEKLQEHNLPVSGRKAELIERLEAVGRVSQKAEVERLFQSRQQEEIVTKEADGAAPSVFKSVTKFEIEELSKMTVVQLKEKLQRLDLSVTGRKAELIERLEAVGRVVPSKQQEFDIAVEADADGVAQLQLSSDKSLEKDTREVEDLSVYTVPELRDRMRRSGLGHLTRAPKAVLIERLQSVDTKYGRRGMNKSDTDWEGMFLRMKAFKAANGHCQVPPGIDEELRNWRLIQKRNFSKLSAERQDRFLELRFYENVDHPSWEQQFVRLEAFKAVHGHCNVPQRYEEDKALGRWVRTQRQRFNNLSKDRQERLLELGFILNMNDAAWEDQFARLKLFQEVNGHCNVPRYYAKDKSLGEWVMVQRHKFNDMSKDRQERLLELGFNVPEKKDHPSWEERFLQLKAFKAASGHCKVPTSYNGDKALGCWVRNQRHKFNILSKDRQERLLELGLNPSNLYDVAWEDKFARLKLFKEVNGHCNVPHPYDKDKSLRLWVDKQRVRFNDMSKVRKERLLELGFIVNPLDAAWEDKFARLKHFKLAEGHCNVPQKYDKDKSLGIWVISQRQKFNNLSEDRQERLLELGFSLKLRCLSLGRSKLHHPAKAKNVG